MSTLKPPLTGTALTEWIASPKPMREPIAEGVLYERSCLIIAADAGTGKSVLSLQAALELSCGRPLFRRFEVKRPYKCYYIIKERPKEEAGERIQYMQKVIPWDPSNFILDEELQSFNLAKESNFEPIIARVCAFSPDIIFLDPIYAGTPGLSKDDVAGSFANFLTQLEQRTKAAIWLNHHVTKTTYDRDGGAISKEDPMYGSAWIRAHVTGCYHLTKSTKGTTLTKKKDSHLNLLDSIELEFDIESYLSTATGQGGSGHDRVMLFLQRISKENRRFTMEEIMRETDLSRPTVLRLYETGPFKGRVINLNPNGVKGLYEYRNP